LRCVFRLRVELFGCRIELRGLSYGHAIGSLGTAAASEDQKKKNKGPHRAIMRPRRVRHNKKGRPVARTALSLKQFQL
jgi:hypothetical protein